MVTAEPKNAIEPTEIPRLDPRFRPLYRGPRYPNRFYPYAYYPNEIQNDFPHHFDDGNQDGSKERHSGKEDTKEVDFPYNFGEDQWNHFDESDTEKEEIGKEGDEEKVTIPAETISKIEEVTTEPTVTVVDDSKNDTLLEARDKKTEENEGNAGDVPKIRSRLLPDDTCGLSVDEKIIGGKDVQIGSYPWMARLGYTRKFYF